MPFIYAFSRRVLRRIKIFVIGDVVCAIDFRFRLFAALLRSCFRQLSAALKLVNFKFVLDFNLHRAFSKYSIPFKSSSPFPSVLLCLGQECAPRAVHGADSRCRSAEREHIKIRKNVILVERRAFRVACILSRGDTHAKMNRKQQRISGECKFRDARRARCTSRRATRGSEGTLIIDEEKHLANASLYYIFRCDIFNCIKQNRIRSASRVDRIAFCDLFGRRADALEAKRRIVIRAEEIKSALGSV